MLDRLLRLIHPLLPFVTEELWTALTGGESVVIARWPGQIGGRRGGRAAGAASRPGGRGGDLGADAAGDRGSQVPLGPGPAAEASRCPPGWPGLAARRWRSTKGGSGRCCGWPSRAPDFAPTASLHAEGVTIELDTAAGLDVAAERKRLAKDLAAAQADIEAVERKLASASFVERAPAQVVAKNRDRLAAAQAEVARLTERLAALPARRRSRQRDGLIPA